MVSRSVLCSPMLQSYSLSDLRLDVLGLVCNVIYGGCDSLCRRERQLWWDWNEYMKKILIGLGILLIAGVVVSVIVAHFAAKSPRLFDLNTLLLNKADSVVEVWIKEARTSTQVDGANTLEVLAQVNETVVGVKIEGEIRGKYEEIHATINGGSGLELRTQANDRVLLWLCGTLKGKKDTYFIKRVEAVEKKAELLKLMTEEFSEVRRTIGV